MPVHNKREIGRCHNCEKHLRKMSFVTAIDTGFKRGWHCSVAGFHLLPRYSNVNGRCGRVGVHTTKEITYRRILIVTTVVTVDFSSAWVTLLSGGRYLCVPKFICKRKKWAWLTGKFQENMSSLLRSDSLILAKFLAFTSEIKTFYLLCLHWWQESSPECFHLYL